MALTPRLAAVLALTPPVAVAADIGTDHGYLPVAWVQSGRVQRAIAADLRAGPLQQAARTVAAAGLSHLIELRQGDGLTVLAPGEAELACLAGVGGRIVQTVLAAVDPLPVRHLLLQPMNGWRGVRHALATRNLALRQEQLVAEGERLYLVLATEQAGPEASETWRPAERLSPAGREALWEAGPQLFARRDPLLQRWLTARRDEIAERLQRVKAGRSDAAQTRQDALDHHLSGLEELLQCW